MSHQSITEARCIREMTWMMPKQRLSLSKQNRASRDISDYAWHLNRWSTQLSLRCVQVEQSGDRKLSKREEKSENFFHILVKRRMYIRGKPTMPYTSMLVLIDKIQKGINNIAYKRFSLVFLKRLSYIVIYHVFNNSGIKNKAYNYRHDP